MPETGRFEEKFFPGKNRATAATDARPRRWSGVDVEPSFGWTDPPAFASKRARLGPPDVTVHKTMPEKNQVVKI